MQQLPQSENKVIVAGGGTGGHVLAGVAIADEWRKKVGEDRVLFVGTKGGLEEKLVPKAGYPLRLLKLGSLNKVSASRKLKTVLQIPFAFLGAAAILLKAKPSHVIGVGGYASGPAVLLAWVLRTLHLSKVRIGILEQNSIPGLTNRILGRFVQVVYTAFPNMESHFPGKKIVLTGNPIRSSLHRFEPAQERPFRLFIFGGSQGAIGINSLLISTLPLLTDLKDRISFVHQTGEKDYDRVQKAYQAFEYPCRVEKFIDDMPKAYAEASLLICRAGSSTLSEIAAVGRAAILVPLPTAADDHQTKNAEVFMHAGAAIVLPQAEDSPSRLAQYIRSFLQNPKELREIEVKVTRFYKPYAAKDLVESFANLSYR